MINKEDSRILGGFECTRKEINEYLDIFMVLFFVCVGLFFPYRHKSRSIFIFNESSWL